MSKQVYISADYDYLSVIVHLISRIRMGRSCVSGLQHRLHQMAMLETLTHILILDMNSNKPRKKENQSLLCTIPHVMNLRGCHHI